MKVLALMQPEMRAGFEQQLAPTDTVVTFISEAAELSALSHTSGNFSVAILPASGPETELSFLLKELRLFDPRPEILIYAAHASFQFWSGLLDAGCRDILLQPFSSGELQRAVLDAANAFEERRAGDPADETY